MRVEQGVLHRVGGFLTVADGAQSHRPEAVAMTADDLPERSRVTVEVGTQEVGVAQRTVSGSHQSNLTVPA
ncbi:hypothetical protein GCM10010172_53540 [Paractinoplanes ferrugineus]|uniref:Uncharacterized protein n=1 Tax=Paractinoplanes ferrugineus TaxID=113564 RepID=A0A919J0U3_9ACTN|nr:hypothetical protein Afe05nite_36680 [Actinoplanes ferrugineus]